MIKTCSKCKAEKPMEDFYFLATEGRYSSACKPCKKASAKEWSNANKERKVRSQQNWIEANRDRKAQVQSEWANKNRHRLNEAMNKYRKAYPGKVLALDSKRRAAKIRAIPSWFGEFEEFAIKEVYNLAKLREKVIGGKWHVDHIIPLQGKNVCGLHVPNNLQIISAEANLRKSNKFTS